jgi:hypothetical protein
MRLSATASVLRRHLINARNEGVRDSNPRVDSLDLQGFSDFMGVGERRSGI